MKHPKSPEKKRVFTPHDHTVSNILISLARQFDPHIVFQNEFRLSRLSPLQKDKERYTLKHRNPVTSQESVVGYEFPVVWGQVYTDQTGRWFESSTKHKPNIKNKKTSSYLLYMHLQECNNSVSFGDECALLEHEFDRMKRINKETTRIALAGNSMSSTFVVFNND